MSVVFCGVVPHPPIMVPEVGGREVEKVRDTIDAMFELAKRIKTTAADTLVFISPHSSAFRDAIALNCSSRLTGSLANFRASSVRFEYENDKELVDEITKLCEVEGISTIKLDDSIAMRFDINLSLDHGVMVPLYFLKEEGINLPLVVISVAMLPLDELYKFGMIIEKASNALGRRVALMASGDLSHRLKPGAPAGYDPVGAEFDQRIIDCLKEANAKELMSLPRDLVERAGECGYRPIIMMMGALHGKKVKPEVLSYEAPFGVGYVVASFEIEDETSCSVCSRGIVESENGSCYESNKNFIVNIARKALESYVLGKKEELEQLLNLKDIPEEFKRRAGTFVSIKKNGKLRGCIGTVFPQRMNIVEEVVHNAISAGVNDPRFYPVKPEELDELEYSVDVLGEPEAISSIEELDPKKYGVIVTSGAKRGLLLPDLEGINTPEEQVYIAMQKAGISPGEKISLERFEVKRYKEK